MQNMEEGNIKKKRGPNYPVNSKLKLIEDINFKKIKSLYYTVSNHFSLTENSRNTVKDFLEEAKENKYFRSFEMEKYIKKLVEVRAVVDVPPLNGQNGVYAVKDIPKFTVLGFYGGTYCNQKNLKLHNSMCTNPKKCRNYIWAINNKPPNNSNLVQIVNEYISSKSTDREHLVSILGFHKGKNQLAFINSPHGIIGAKASVKPIALWCNGAPRILYITIKDIKKDDQLYIDYGNEFDYDKKNIDISDAIILNSNDYNEDMEIDPVIKELDRSNTSSTFEDNYFPMDIDADIMNMDIVEINKVNNHHFYYSDHPKVRLTLEWSNGKTDPVDLNDHVKNGKIINRYIKKYVEDNFKPLFLALYGFRELKEVRTLSTTDDKLMVEVQYSDGSFEDWPIEWLCYIKINDTSPVTITGYDKYKYIPHSLLSKYLTELNNNNSNVCAHMVTEIKKHVHQRYFS